MDGCVWKGSWELLTVRCGERKRRRRNGKHNKANELLRNTQVPGDCLTRCLGCSTLLMLLHSLSSTHSSSTSVLFVVVVVAWSSNALVVCLCPVSSSMHKLTSYVFPFHLCLRVCVCPSVYLCVSVCVCVLVSFILLVIHTCMCVCVCVMSCEWVTSLMNKYSRVCSAFNSFNRRRKVVKFYCIISGAKWN